MPASLRQTTAEVRPTVFSSQTHCDEEIGYCSTDILKVYRGNRADVTVKVCPFKSRTNSAAHVDEANSLSLSTSARSRWRHMGLDASRCCYRDLEGMSME